MKNIRSKAKKNTSIVYQYRDADNYKVAHEIVVLGRLSLREIKPYLSEGLYFIPFEVGLLELQDELAQWNGGNMTYADHVWHEILEVTSTSAKPNEDSVTARQLVKAFSLAKWDVSEAVKRLGIPV